MVLASEVKAFMNEPDAEVKAPESLMFDDWTQSIENENDFKISTKQMCRMAYTSVMQLDTALLGTDSKMGPYSSLSEEMLRHVESKVNYFIAKAANPNGYEECAALHDLVLSAKLHDGWSYATVLDEGSKQDPLIMPYRCLDVHLRTYDYLFRSIVISLLQIWRGV